MLVVLAFKIINFYEKIWVEGETMNAFFFVSHMFCYNKNLSSKVNLDLL